jgi:hypothetical protein
VRKAADIGKVGETKRWKKVVLKTEDFCEKVNSKTKVMLKKAGKAVKENISDMKESFREGIESAADETIQDKAVSEPTAHGPKVSPEVKVKKIPANQKIPALPEKEAKAVSEQVVDQSPASTEVKVEEIPVLEHYSDSVKIKKAIDEITHKNKKPLPARKKSSIKEKPKTASKKAKHRAKAEKEVPVDVDLEKEIENTTKGVKEI